MANYLMPSDGEAATTPGVARGRDDIISVDNMYRVKIYNKSGSIKFSGFIPPDFSFSLASAWSAPFGDTTMADWAEKGGNALGGVGGNRVLDAVGSAGRFIGNNAQSANRAMKFSGASTMNKMLSAKLWGGPSYLEINLPIFIDAYYDTREEVVATTVNLLGLCAPTDIGAGVLIPPGPSPFKQTTNEAADSVGQNTNLDDAEAFTVDIGNFFTMGPCVVDSVNANFDNVWEDGSGNPISVDFILQVSSYFAVTREDLKKWLKLPQQ